MSAKPTPGEWYRQEAANWGDSARWQMEYATLVDAEWYDHDDETSYYYARMAGHFGLLALELELIYSTPSDPEPGS